MVWQDELSYSPKFSARPDKSSHRNIYFLSIGESIAIYFCRYGAGYILGRENTCKDTLVAKVKFIKNYILYMVLIENCNIVQLHPKAILTELKVGMLRNLREEKVWSYGKLVIKFEISKSHVVRLYKYHCR